MIAQLKSSAHAGSPTDGYSGKKEKMNATVKKASVMSLIGPPHLPSDHLRGRSGSPRKRFSRRQPTEMMYENSRAAFDTDRIAFSAVGEPKLMAERMRDTTRHTKS